MMPVQQQLPHVPFFLRRHPDPWKPALPQQLQDQLGIFPVGLLLAHRRRPYARPIAHPQLVPAFAQQSTKPLARWPRFHPHSHPLALPLQLAVKPPPPPGVAPAASPSVLPFGCQRSPVRQIQHGNHSLSSTSLAPVRAASSLASQKHQNGPRQAPASL